LVYDFHDKLHSGWDMKKTNKFIGRECQIMGGEIKRPTIGA
jgi:hypothetical protein